ncbi:hypothetical protein T4D_507 [Trichinella pseudospiralis]|uniref:Uncharacterized protein n=1 Tax=Trichinella pseudospiralis TaxID=6337 RepID=A0A0V1F8X6_TRIPS|nr:hypothetical protein T4D_507 [Trichinella pseudospiralis]
MIKSGLGIFRKVEVSVNSIRLKIKNTVIYSTLIAKSPIRRLQCNRSIREEQNFYPYFGAVRGLKHCVLFEN